VKIGAGTTGATGTTGTTGFRTGATTTAGAGATGAATTPRVKVDETDCAGEPESIAVRVKVVIARISVGVPLIRPVAGSNVKPAGRAGDTEYVNGAVPPATVTGVKGVIAEFCVAEVLAMEVFAVNGPGATSSVKSACDVPPAASVAVMV